MQADQAFFTALAELHYQQMTATIVATTAQALPITVQFVAGQITALQVGDCLGWAAIARLETLQVGQWHFQYPAPRLVSQIDLPETSDILNALALRIPLDCLALAMQPTALEVLDVVVSGVGAVGWSWESIAIQRSRPLRRIYRMRVRSVPTAEHYN
jgi:hypothetical protein